jgi:hypothetical protein
MTTPVAVKAIFQYKIFDDVIIVSNVYYNSLTKQGIIDFIKRLTIAHPTLEIVPLDITRIVLAGPKIKEMFINDKYAMHRLQIQLDRELTETELTIIDNFCKSVKSLDKLFETIHGNSDYPFVEIVNSIHDNVYYTLSKTRIRRKCSDHYISFSDAEKIWNKVKDYWRDSENAPLPESYYASMITNGRSYSQNQEITFNTHLVRIGCQAIQRHELEQLATHCKWEIPA